ncbi:right-handed parallel beta-helix repeat-containing protein [candidate division KSB1 bacterium]|nr:right-handed parallel beta-helix repeat-containing protein [candidate division KSB1 bacterium]
MKFHMNYFFLMFPLIIAATGFAADKFTRPIVHPLKVDRVVTVGGEGADIRGFTSAAIQKGIEALIPYNGGTVKLTAGVFEISAPVSLFSNVTLTGEGKETVLHKIDGFKTSFIIDADYGELVLTVKDPSVFAPGMGIQIFDEKQNNGWAVTTAKIIDIQDNNLYIDTYLVRDYRADQNGVISNACSIISAVSADNVHISNLSVDGNKQTNDFLNGCRGGGIYLHKVKNAIVENVLLKDFNGDGFSWQITEDVTVRYNEVLGCSNYGLHPGTGSFRSLIEGNKSHDNRVNGLFVCWRVQNGVVKNNSFYNNGQYGICTGHKDTDMLFEENHIYENGSDGVNFRSERESNAPHRNVFRNNVVENNGAINGGYGFSFNSPAKDVVLEYNIIRNTGKGTQKAGVCIYKNGLPVSLKENNMSGHPDGDVVSEKDK